MANLAPIGPNQGTSSKSSNQTDGLLGKRRVQILSGLLFITSLVIGVLNGVGLLPNIPDIGSLLSKVIMWGPGAISSLFLAACILKYLSSKKTGLIDQRIPIDPREEKGRKLLNDVKETHRLDEPQPLNFDTHERRFEYYQQLATDLLEKPASLSLAVTREDSKTANRFQLSSDGDIRRYGNKLSQVLLALDDAKTHLSSLQSSTNETSKAPTSEYSKNINDLLTKIDLIDETCLRPILRKLQG